MSKRFYNNNKQNNNKTTKKSNDDIINKFSALDVDSDSDKEENSSELKKSVLFSSKSHNNNESIKEDVKPIVHSSSFSKFDDNLEWQPTLNKKKGNRSKYNDNYSEIEKYYGRDKTHLISNEPKESEKNLYVEDLDTDYGNKLYLNSKWTVWVHKSKCETWRESDYTLAYEIDSIGTLQRFFNSFHLYDKQNYQFFIMRNKIKPIWEDNENRKGFICSIKFDCAHKPGKIDIGTDAMFMASLLVMNETFTTNNKDINGLTYSVKNKSVLIKIWNRNGSIDLKSYETKIQQSLFKTKLESLLKSSYRGYHKNADELVSIKCKLIEPEYET